MRATALEYRLRFPLQTVVVILGFWPFWEQWLGVSTKSTWLTLSAALARAGWLGFQAATVVLLMAALLFTVLGAWFRVSGSAYIRASFRDPTRMPGDARVAGPFRYTRNPLPLGTLLHVFGIALLMPPVGALFAITLTWILQVRLALSEELFSENCCGQSYHDYMARVPRFLPAPRPRMPASGIAGRWGQACLSEIYYLGVVITLLFFGWHFNATPLFQGILISFGAGIVVQALLPGIFQSTPPVKI